MFSSANESKEEKKPLNRVEEKKVVTREAIIQTSLLDTLLPVISNIVANYDADAIERVNRYMAGIETAASLNQHLLESFQNPTSNISFAPNSFSTEHRTAFFKQTKVDPLLELYLFSTQESEAAIKNDPYKTIITALFLAAAYMDKTKSIRFLECNTDSLNNESLILNLTFPLRLEERSKEEHKTIDAEFTAAKKLYPTLCSQYPASLIQALLIKYVLCSPCPRFGSQIIGMMAQSPPLHLNFSGSTFGADRNFGSMAFKNHNFRNARVGVLEKEGASGNFVDTDFSGSDFAGAIIGGIFSLANFSNTNFFRARFTRGDGPGHLHAAECTDFKEANFFEADLREIQASNMNFSQAKFPKADLRGANLSNSILKGAILKDTKVTGASFIDADLSRTTLENVDFTGTLLMGANFVESFPDPATQRSICKELRLLGTTCGHIEHMAYYSSLTRYLNKFINEDGSTALPWHTVAYIVRLMKARDKHGFDQLKNEMPTRLAGRIKVSLFSEPFNLELQKELNEALQKVDESFDTILKRRWAKV